MLASACQRCIVIYTEISVCRIGYNILCHREADRISLLKTGISQNNLTRNINQIRLLVRPSHISFIDFGIESWKRQRHSKMLFSSAISALEQIWLESYRWTIIGISPKYTATQTMNATTQKRDAHRIHACRKIISTQVKFGGQQHAKGKPRAKGNSRAQGKENAESKRLTLGSTLHPTPGYKNAGIYIINMQRFFYFFNFFFIYIYIFFYTKTQILPEYNDVKFGKFSRQVITL